MASYSAWMPYTEADVRANVPTTAGVYMISVQLKDDTWQIVYVGQGKLRERLLDHLSPSEPNDCLREHQKYATECCWLELSRKGQRDHEELAKIHKYQPECNDQGT